MKRFTSALASLVFPVAFAFALTARPAVLYAESSAPVTCTTTSKACEGKSAAAACTTDQGKAGTCAATRCASPDGGAASTLVCLQTATTTPTPGKTIPEEGTEPAPGAPAATDDGGCSLSAASTPSTAPAGFALAGLAFAALAFARRARKLPTPRG